MPYPFALPELSGNEWRYLNECLRTGKVAAQGGFINKLEAAVAEHLQVPHVLAIHHVQSAWKLAIIALGLARKDEVIVPALIDPKFVQIIQDCGSRPVIADSDPMTGCISPESVTQLIRGRTRAILASHLFGHPCDLNPLRELANRYGVWLIEHVTGYGATYHKKMVGTMGDFSILDCSESSVLTCGQGALLVTAQQKLVDSWHRFLPWNAPERMPHLAAAIGLAQFERLPGVQFHQQRLVEGYMDRLRDCPEVSLPVQAADVQPVPSGLGILLPDRATRDRVLQSLQESEIEARAIPSILAETALFRSLRNDNNCPVARDQWERGICLPMGITWKELDQDVITSRLRTALEEGPTKLMLRRIAA